MIKSENKVTKLKLEMDQDQLMLVQQMLEELPIRYTSQVQNVLNYMDQFVKPITEETPKEQDHA